MAKGRQVPLHTADGRPLNLVRMGIGWRSAPHPGSLGPCRHGRLSSFALLYGQGRFLDTVFAENPAHPDGSIEHIAGPVVEDIAGDGDQESFVARLSRLPPHADRIVFAVSSFHGSTFETVQSAHCRVVDERLGHGAGPVRVSRPRASHSAGHDGDDPRRRRLDHDGPRCSGGVHHLRRPPPGSRGAIRSAHVLSGPEAL
ncbi:TerD family protein [Streptomyces sp. NPDC048370]|uniref:TerD family protein n=1 Tax=Streptomyces sp. NPDC048370 TaxID=3365540 RepID=UPI003716F0B0